MQGIHLLSELPLRLSEVVASRELGGIQRQPRSHWVVDEKVGHDCCAESTTGASSSTAKLCSSAILPISSPFCFAATRRRRARSMTDLFDFAPVYSISFGLRLKAYCLHDAGTLHTANCMLMEASTLRHVLAVAMGMILACWRELADCTAFLRFRRRSQVRRLPGCGADP